jgi:hypothetical protein
MGPIYLTLMIAGTAGCCFCLYKLAATGFFTDFFTGKN